MSFVLPYELTQPIRLPLVVVVLLLVLAFVGLKQLFSKYFR